VAHLPIVDADAPALVQARTAGGGEVVGEKALDLLDAAFVQPFVLHHAVEQRNVERHHGNGRAGLGDQRFVDGNDGGARAVALVHAGGGLLEVFLGPSNGAVGVDGEGQFRSDVGVGDGLRPLG